jgi:thymidine kinase
MVQLNVYVGPMFSGKTSKILRKLEREAFLYNGLSLYITHSSDEERSKVAEDIVTSHSAITSIGSNSNHTLVQKIRSATLTDLELHPYAAIGIDEGQFFKAADLVDTVRKLLAFSNQHLFPNLHTLFVCGLDGDCTQQSFPGSGIERLLPMADTFEKLTTAICVRCREDHDLLHQASFTVRKKNAPPGDIGGDERYEAVCRKCL